MHSFFFMKKAVIGMQGEDVFYRKKYVYKNIMAL
jgi:hypothetical protein